MKKTLVLIAGLVLILGATAYLTNNQDPDAPYNWDERHQPVPEKRIFQTDYKGGTLVVFDHKFHTEDLETDCIACHHVEACRHCHKEKVRVNVDVQEAKVALHENCYDCHEGMTCTDCHKE